MGLAFWFLIAAMWGFAEATLFFIVPDVFLTWLALAKGLRVALLSAAVTGIGAVLGGALMIAWGAVTPDHAREILILIPAISPAMIEGVSAGYSDGWLMDLFRGALTGIPYKIFAVEAGATGVNPMAFLAATFPARLGRFCLAIFTVSYLHHLLNKAGLGAWRFKLWATVWIVLYAVYFTVVG